MTGPIFPTPNPTLAAAGPAVAAFLAWMVLTGLVSLLALIRVVRRPADQWPHGNVSKILWVLAVLYGVWPVAGFPIAFGAIAAIYRTRRPADTVPPGQLPMVEGTPGIWEDK